MGQDPNEKAQYRLEFQHKHTAMIISLKKILDKCGRFCTGQISADSFAGMVHAIANGGLDPVGFGETGGQPRMFWKKHNWVNGDLCIKCLDCGVELASPPWDFKKAKTEYNYFCLPKYVEDFYCLLCGHKWKQESIESYEAQREAQECPQCNMKWGFPYCADRSSVNAG